MNSHILLSSLQAFLQRRSIDVDSMTPIEMIHAMVDWYRSVPLDIAGVDRSADALLYRYGGWSEGCATGFRLSLLRRVRSGEAGERTDWMAGMTMMFDPSRFADVAPLSSASTDWQTLDAFLTAIESSRGFKLVSQDAPMGAMLEVGGLR